MGSTNQKWNTGIGEAKRKSVSENVLETDGGWRTYLNYGNKSNSLSKYRRNELVS